MILSHCFFFCLSGWPPPYMTSFNIHCKYRGFWGFFWQYFSHNRDKIFLKSTFLLIKVAIMIYHSFNIFQPEMQHSDPQTTTWFYIWSSGSHVVSQVASWWRSLGSSSDSARPSASSLLSKSPVMIQPGRRTLRLTEGCWIRFLEKDGGWRFLNSSSPTLTHPESRWPRVPPLRFFFFLRPG